MKEQNISKLKKSAGQLIVGTKYTVQRSLYEGANSHIYTISFDKNRRQLTRIIKLEDQFQCVSKNKKDHISTSSHFSSLGLKDVSKNTQQSIKTEVSVLRKLLTNQKNEVIREPGFAHLYQYGTQNNTNYMVMDMCGPNLGQLMKLCGGNFSLRTTLIVCLQIIDRLQILHEKRYLYNNFMPQNFMMGLGSQSYLVYMFDFGNALIYKSHNKNVHIQYQNRICNFDLTYQSINCHLKIQPSRRDDIQSFMYLLIYLTKGRLPWSRVEGKNRKQKQIQVLQMKQKIPPQSLFRNLPSQLCDIFYYTKSLSFYEKPDYQFIRQKLWNSIMQTNYQQLKNSIITYDWNHRDGIDYQLYCQSPGIKVKKNLVSVQSDQQGDNYLFNQSKMKVDIIINNQASLNALSRSSSQSSNDGDGDNDNS